MLLEKQGLDYSDKVIDIIQYGSSVMESVEPNDIDIAVIYRSGTSLKEQLEESQKIKGQLRDRKELDVKSFTIESLFEPSNFAREGIMLYGVSILNKRYFARLFGLDPKIHVKYNLSQLEKKDKVRLNYFLSGKREREGILKKSKGKILSPGLIEIPPEYEKVIVERLKTITDNVDVKGIFNIL